MSRTLAANMSVLTTKLYVPPARVGLVSRPRLRQRLDAALSLGQRLLLISAPAGYGKTTLVTDWLEHVDQPHVWFSVDESDNDPVRFLQYLTLGLAQANAQHGPHADSPATVQPSSVESMLTGLVNDMVSLGTPLLLVLDDYHTIRTQAIHNSVEFLLKNAPPTLLLILITREDPPLSLSHLRGRAQLTEIRADDLEFTDEEATSFFSQAMGLSLNAETIRALQTRTEGWVAGLQLAGLSLQGHHDRAQFVAEFTGSHRYILDYLVEQVLSRQPESVQNFLLRTSILDRLSGPLCGAVIEKSDVQLDGQAMLEWIEQADLFLIPLDDERRWYRYHQLFRDVLSSRLIHAQPQLVPELHRRAMEWYDQNGLPAEAIRHALLAQDYEVAARLIEQAALTMLKRSEFSTWLSWLEQLPSSVRQQHPALMLFYGWMLVFTGQLQTAEQALALLSKGDLPPQLTNLLDVVWANLFGLRGDSARSAEFAQQALTAEEQNTATGDEFHLIILLSATVMLGESQRVQGKINAAIQTYQRALVQVKPDDIDASWMTTLGSLEVRFGWLLYEQNDLAAAEQHVARGLAIAQRLRNETFSLQASVFLAMILHAQGHPDQALEMMQSATRLAHKRNVAIEVLFYDAYQAKLMLIQGDLSAASNWASTYQPGSSIGGEPAGQRIEFIQRFADCVWARVLLAQDKSGQAAEFLEELRARAESTGHMGIVIETLALEALAFHVQGDTTRAFAVLERALTLGEPEGYVRTFMDEGEPMRLRIADCRLQIEKQHGEMRLLNYADKLLAAFPASSAEKVVKSEIINLKTEILVEPLSDREKQVLELLVEGLSNRDIAKRLTISIGTVKRHTWNIYAKLGVSNRTQAILKAKELGLV